MAEIKDKSSKEWKVWCHLCNVGFDSLEAGQVHDKEKLNDHRRMNEARQEKKGS